MSKDYLLEIGTEEMPARFIPATLNELGIKAKELFKIEMLTYRGIKTYGTPRRLALQVKGLEGFQKDYQEEIKGPPHRIAYDDSGNPTKAALGFARKQGIDVKDLESVDIDGTTYVYAIHKKKGEPVEKVLPRILPDLIKSLEFAKPMRWGDKETRFVRPIRWIVSVYDSEIIHFTYAGVEAGNLTKGHRFLANKEVEVTNASRYLEILESRKVIVDQDKRRELVWQGIEELASKNKGLVKDDKDLLEEVNYLLEYPTAICGDFDEEYLKLPEEVLVTSMREHQKYFPIYNDEGRMLPKFITVRNGMGDPMGIVRQGNERVLQARLADADFFYSEDLKSSLSSRVNHLKNVVFQEGLGSVFDKCQRLQNMITFISETFDMDRAFMEDARRAAYLCKADLTTNMVIEFPELQGLMGYYYARHSGERESVSRAIKEHYMPRFSEDKLPASDVGKLLSMVDKLDNIIGCFSLGIQPTGSQDPYALRRQALGFCKLILDFNKNLSFEDMWKHSYMEFSDNVELELTWEDVNKPLSEFFHQRVVNVLEDEGYRHDIIQAAMSVGWGDLVDLRKRVKALKEFEKNRSFNVLLTGFNRASNLSQGYRGDEIRKDLLVEDSEKELYNSFIEVDGLTEEMLRTGDYLGALRRIADLSRPIDNFFDDVMIMVKDEKIRNNRLALLKAISSLMSSIGDLSKIMS
ncbi:MAG: glycine--tRNA ligase subunit beta [Clostridia bacterium]|nr:glycine--tRNA ligase subunit beta [Clostridia bacterium]